jgi:hypothetical protein
MALSKAAALLLPFLLAVQVVVSASALRSGRRHGGHRHHAASSAASGSHWQQQLPAQPKHFVVALIDDLGGYNVPWRNPEQTLSADLQQLSTAEGMRLENFYTFKYCLLLLAMPCVYLPALLPPTPPPHSPQHHSS